MPALWRCSTLASGGDVLEHTIKNGRTHPYDIHQILTFYQLLDPGYTLTA